jgi:hypothetical protein
MNVTDAVYTESDPGFKRGDQLHVSDGRILSIEGVRNAAGADRFWEWACLEVLS